MSDTKANLESLYPFLHGKRKDGVSENEALLESVKQKALHSIDVKQGFFDTNGQALVDVAKAVAGIYRNGHRMFSMDNNKAPPMTETNQMSEATV